MYLYINKTNYIEFAAIGILFFMYNDDLVTFEAS